MINISIIVDPFSKEEDALYEFYKQHKLKVGPDIYLGEVFGLKSNAYVFHVPFNEAPEWYNNVREVVKCVLYDLDIMEVVPSILRLTSDEVINTFMAAKANNEFRMKLAQKQLTMATKAYANYKKKLEVE